MFMNWWKIPSHSATVATESITAKLAPIFTGPFSVTKYSSDMNYTLNKLPEGTDTGIFMF